jgi:hypothetical protein
LQRHFSALWLIGACAIPFWIASVLWLNGADDQLIMAFRAVWFALWITPVLAILSIWLPRFRTAWLVTLMAMVAFVIIVGAFGSSLGLQYDGP